MFRLNDWLSLCLIQPDMNCYPSLTIKYLHDMPGQADIYCLTDQVIWDGVPVLPIAYEIVQSDLRI